MAAESQGVSRAWAAVGLRVGDGVVNVDGSLLGGRRRERAGARARRRCRGDPLWTRIHAIVPKDRLRGRPARAMLTVGGGWIFLPTQGGAAVLSACRRACAGFAPVPRARRG